MTAASLVIAAAGLASADSITYGIDPSTGLYTVTQTASLSGVNLNVASPTSLFSFLSFNSLGIANGIYVGSDTTFDYELTNTLSVFSVQNLDTNTDTVNASVQSLITNDTATTLPNYPNYTGFLQVADKDLGIPNNNNSFAPIGTPGTETLTLASTPNGGVSLGSQGVYTYPGLPRTTTIGIGYNNCLNFGVVNAASGVCAAVFNDTGNYFLSNGFSFGTADNQQFGESLTGTGNLDLNIQATTQYTAEAEVTYEYSIASATPEPATMLLMGGALVGLGMFGRKRFKKG